MKEEALEEMAQRWYKRFDPRTKDLPFMASPYQVPLILVLYCLLIYIIIPRYMKNKQPYVLKTFTRCYNVFQIITNGYITLETVHLVRSGVVTIYCDVGSGDPEDKDHRKLAMLVFGTAMLKLVDLAETIVFALRKKNNQISFLHVYHHVTMVLLSWIIARHLARGMTIVALSINCFVHTIMYTYYFLSTFETMKPVSDKMKQSITTLQLGQFVLLLIHISQTIYPGCGIPTILPTICVIEVVTNLFLFLHFYKKNYTEKKVQ